MLFGCRDDKNSTSRLQNSLRTPRPLGNRYKTIAKEAFHKNGKPLLMSDLVVVDVRGILAGDLNLREDFAHFTILCAVIIV